MPMLELAVPPKAARRKKAKGQTGKLLVERLRKLPEEEWDAIYANIRKNAAPQIAAYDRARARSLQTVKHQVLR